MWISWFAKSKLITIAVSLTMILATLIIPLGTVDAAETSSSTPIQSDCFLAPDIVTQTNRTLNAVQGSPEPGFYDTSEYFIGTISVELIFVESDGSFDSNYETWTSPQMTTVSNEVLSGLNWWADNPLGPGINGILHSDLITTRYEPILRPASDEGLWISQIMSKQGYSTGSYFNQVRSYVNDMRANDGNDWGWVIFVVNSYNDADGKFTDGHFAYAYLGGPFMVMTYDNDGWGIGNMDRVTAHETGHIFYATDEYDGVYQYSGYLNSQEVENSGCVMDDNTLALSSGTCKQVGWRDVDSDGIFDIVDVAPTVTLDQHVPDPTNVTSVTYLGNTTVPPYPNNNPFGPGNDITIAEISAVYYALDGSGWSQAIAGDGAFDEATETYQFSISPSSGYHQIWVMAQTDQGVYSTSYGYDELTIDRTPPSSQVSSAPVLTNLAQFTIQATATDDLQISSLELWYSRNNGDYKLYSTLLSAPWQWSFMTILSGGEGSYSFYTRAKDTAGNIEQRPSSPDIQITVDLTNPVSVVQSMPDYSNSSRINIAATASDSVGLACVELWYRSTESSWMLFGTLYSPPWIWNFNSSSSYGDGDYEFYSRARDTAGNYENAPGGVDTSITIDTEPPLVGGSVIGNQRNGEWYGPSTKLALTAEDATSGISTILYRIDSGSWENYSTQIRIADGIHTIEYYAIDNASNYGIHQHLVLKVDESIPIIQYFTPKGKFTKSQIALSWNAIDDTSGIDHFEMSIDHGAFVILNNNQTVMELSLIDGNHTIILRAYDQGGNFAESTIYIVIDTSLLSVNGPAGPWVIIGIIATATGIGFIILIVRKRRKGDEENDFQPPIS